MSDPRCERVLAALATGVSVSEAARQAGVRRNTVYFWRRTRPWFRRRVAEVRARVLVETLNTC